MEAWYLTVSSIQRKSYKHGRKCAKVTIYTLVWRDQVLLKLDQHMKS